MAQQKAAVSIPAYLRRRFFAHPVVDTTWQGGMVRDASQVPDGALYDAQDFLVEQPSHLYKRGGWERLSAAMSDNAMWVSTISSPGRVVAIDRNKNLYDVTSQNAPQATLVQSLNYVPFEKSAIDGERVIICDTQQRAYPPQVVQWNGSTLAIEVVALAGSPPVAAFSSSHISGIVLAGGADEATSKRIWFEPDANDIANGRTNWDTSATGSWIDNPYVITGLASIGGVLLVFSAHGVHRITGGEAPGTGHSNNGTGDMTLQPFLTVGTPDARSITYADEGVIFAGEDGIWWTNGSGVKSLTEKGNGTGIQSYWREFFPRQEYGTSPRRDMVGGIINRDFYIISVFDTGSLDGSGNYPGVVTLMCHIPTASWTRISNFIVRSMTTGSTQGNVSECYMAEANAPYISKASPMLVPKPSNANDGDGNPIQPYFVGRNISTGVGMKSYGFGWLTYNMEITENTFGGTWQANHAFNAGDKIVVLFQNQSFGPKSLTVMQCQTDLASSGAVEPNWKTAINYGDTIGDGGLVWTNIGPTLVINCYKDIARYGQTTPHTIVASSDTSTQFANRKRFTINTDTQALWFQVKQMGPSANTEIQEIEAEEEIYWPTADSLGR